MSGIAGILRLDGGPADGAVLARMTSAFAHRGPDGIHHEMEGRAALGHCMLCTTPESLHETQPLWDETRTRCLVMDGRVDNPEELRTLLVAAGFPPRDDTDAELVLQAYAAWGEDCAAAIIGDFALVVYDKQKRRLFCARDPIGVKPFYYWTDGRIFLCASELRQLFEHPAVRKEPNEGMVAEYLAAQITSLEDTLYADIFRLPPAHWMRVSAEGIVKRRYWDADPMAEPAKGSTEDLALQLGEILKEAVGCRLRSHRPVGAELSGGLDSSSVVGLAQLLFREGRAPDLGFEAFSLVFPGLACDESEYIDAVAELWGLKVNKFVPDNGRWYEESARLHQDFPDHPNGCMSKPLYRDLARRGFRAYLTGIGGDQWLDRFYDVGFRAGLRAWLERYPGLFAIARRIARRPSHPKWIDRDFARRVRLDARLNRAAPRRRFRTLSQRRQHELLVDGHNVHALEMTDRMVARFGLEARHPLEDRRVIQFALPLADSLHRDQVGDTGKVLLRAAMSELLPAAVLNRRSKADFSHLLSTAVEQASEVLEAPAVATPGWLNVEALSDVRRSCRSNPWPRWFLLGTETWYRAVTR